MVNTKSRIGTNWAKSLKIDKIVQMLINVSTKYYRNDKLERQCSLHTHSLPVTTGSGQIRFNTLLQLLFIYKKTANRPIWPMQISSNE